MNKIALAAILATVASATFANPQAATPGHEEGKKSGSTEETTTQPHDEKEAGKSAEGSSDKK